MNIMRELMLSKLITCLWSIYRFILGFLYVTQVISIANDLLIFIAIFFPFVKGRALLNAIGNLQLSGPYAEALRKLGYSLEDVANQVFSYYRSSLFPCFYFC